MEDLPQLEWMERYLRRLAELQPGAAENDDMDQAEDVWRSARGDLTPEQAAEAVAEQSRQLGAGTVIAPRP